MNINDELTELRTALNDESTVLFIGSGISAWSGLPSWDKVLMDLADIIESKGYNADAVRENIRTQPLMAASYGKHYLTNEEFAEFIKNECYFGKAKPHKIHQLITNLGPTCYITTNYDNLLELSLKKYSRKTNYKKILNNQPLDCNGILSVRAKNYIFKVHGDVTEPETIVLTNEQYEAQYSSGSRVYAARALENILLTRTVVFIGYGLKDPDFLQIIAKIKNEFQQSFCSHYALVADCSNVEKDFWKNNYNINLISFNGRTKDGYDYNKLFSFLEALSPFVQKIQHTKTAKVTKQQRNSLERYLNLLIYGDIIEEELVFPLQIKVEKYSRWTFLSAKKVLSELPENNFIVTGSPGIGKSFFLKQYCRQMAVLCHQNLDNIFKKNSKNKIPVYVDLKTYNGRDSILEQVIEQFPDKIPVKEWLVNGRFILFVDSFNEIPTQYRENKLCMHEINGYSYKNIVIVGDRTGEDLERYFSGKYQLLNIESEYIEEYLFKRKISFSKDKKHSILAFLEKPLFFRLLQQNKICVDNTTTAHSLYDTYFEYLNGEFQKKFQKDFDSKEVFLSFAYDLIVSGGEGFTIDKLTMHLCNYLNFNEMNLVPMNMINWLIE